MPMSRCLFACACLALVAGASACCPRYIYDEHREIPNGQWAYADSLRYEVSIADTNRIYNLWLTLEHSPAFAWQNLYVRIHTVFPDGLRLSTPLSLELANQGGVWQGRCNAQRCRFKIPIQERAYFQLPGRYTFIIEQYMRQSPVSGVERLRFQVEDTKRTK